VQSRSPQKSSLRLAPRHRTGTGRARQLALALLAAVALSGCASYSPQPLHGWPDPARVQVKEQHGITVAAGILTDEEAETLYGADLDSVGLQAIWLRVENSSAHTHWLLVSALDGNYFAPDEAAALFQGRLSDEDDLRIAERFRSLAIPLRSRGGQTSEGYVLTPKHEGGRYVQVALAGREHLVKLGFAIRLADGTFDFEDVDPNFIYPGQQRPDLTLEEVRARLGALPCCAANDQGDHRGDPLNLVLVGSADEVLASLARAGWSFTHRISIDSIERLVGAAISGSNYPVAPISPLYFMERPQDVAMQRARNTVLQRNHLRLWLLPFTLGSRSVWIGQVSRDISIKPSLTSLGLVTHVIDPNVDEAREHLLQSLMVAGAIHQFGFVMGSVPATPEAPAFNLSGDPYHSDGLRLFASLAGTEFIPPRRVVFLDWNDSADPTADHPGPDDRVAEAGE
jgi:hypothetical protein